MARLTIITSTIGQPELPRAVKLSALQSEYCRQLVVVDGMQFADKALKSLEGLPEKHYQVMVLPENTGSDAEGNVTHYGYRINAGIPHFVNTEFVCFLDYDNWYDPHFAERMLSIIGGCDVATCRRKVWSSDMQYIGVDNFESVGKELFDTNTLVFRTEAYCKHYCQAWAHGGWPGDRLMTKRILEKNNYVHIHDPLVNYVSPDRLDAYFMGNCT